MIEHEALELLQQTAVKAAGIIDVTQADMPVIAVPDGLKLVDIEHYQSGRCRFRGNYTTSRLSEFLAYVSRRVEQQEGAQIIESGRANPSVFIDTDHESAVAYFNLGEPGEAGHADDRATLGLAKTAAFASLVGIVGKQLAQKSLAEWLEDWSAQLTPIYSDGEQAHTLKSAIAAVRNITISAQGEASSKVNDFGASRTALENIEAKSKEHLPAGFAFSCEPYAGFQRRDFQLRLSVITDPQQPKLVLRLVAFEDVQEQIAEEFELLSRAGLPNGVAIYRGTYRA